MCYDFKMNIRKRTRPVYGYGINDVDYLIEVKIGDKRKECPYYRKWKKMLERVYSIPYHSRKPTYKDCTVCDEWHYLSQFKAWMEVQDWKGNDLDKDVLFPNNKHYSPETCVFIPRKINTFLLDGEKLRGKYLIGVTWNTRSNRFQSQIRYNNKNIYLGLFDTEIEAHNAWKDHKIMQFNELINDPVNAYIKFGLIKHRDLLI